MESLTIVDVFVGIAVCNLCKNKEPGDLISQVSPALQRKPLNDLLQKLAITAPYRWCSLRRGGAIHEFRRSNNLASVCLKGRWTEVRAARIAFATVWHSCLSLALLSRLDYESICFIGLTPPHPPVSIVSTFLTLPLSRLLLAASKR